MRMPSSMESEAFSIRRRGISSNDRGWLVIQKGSTTLARRMPMQSPHMASCRKRRSSLRPMDRLLSRGPMVVGPVTMMIAPKTTAGSQSKPAT